MNEFLALRVYFPPLFFVGSSGRPCRFPFPFPIKHAQEARTSQRFGTGWRPQTTSTGPKDQPGSAQSFLSHFLFRGRLRTEAELEGSQIVESAVSEELEAFTSEFLWANRQRRFSDRQDAIKSAFSPPVSATITCFFNRVFVSSLLCFAFGVLLFCSTKVFTLLHCRHGADLLQAFKI